MIISASEFVKGYCIRSGITESEFYATKVPMPDQTSPWGWAAVSNDPLLIKAHVDLYLSQQPENKTQIFIGDEGPVTFLGAHIEPHQIVTSDECRMKVAPVVPDDVLNALQDVARIRADLNNLDGDCRGVGSCLWEAEERLLEIVAQRSAMLSGGKS